jgi:hypothetical protein
MKVISFFIALFICSSISAQINIDSMRLQYNQKTMLLGSGVTMNGFMLGKTEVQNLMLVSPEATRSYKLYVKNNRTGSILPVISLAAVVGGLIISKDNRTPGLVMILGGNTINIIGSVFRRIANIHLQKAVWTYNRDVIFPVK